MVPHLDLDRAKGSINKGRVETHGVLGPSLVYEGFFKQNFPKARHVYPVNFDRSFKG